MRILFLDDDFNRFKAFRQLVIGTDYKHVSTAKQCMLALMNDEPYDVVQLDHDLGGKTFQQEKENSGTEVADFIQHVLPKHKYPRQIIIHSWNPQGASRMMQYIAKTKIPCTYYPFKANQIFFRLS